MKGKLVCFMYSTDRKLLAKIYNKGADYQILVYEIENQIAERWCSRYKPYNISQTRAMEIVEEIFKEKL